MKLSRNNQQGQMSGHLDSVSSWQIIEISQKLSICESGDLNFFKITPLLYYEEIECLKLLMAYS